MNSSPASSAQASGRKPFANHPAGDFSKPVLSVGIGFCLALLAQVMAAHWGGFGLVGSIALVGAGICLIGISGIGLLAIWLRDSPVGDRAARGKFSRVGMACAFFACTGAGIYAVRWVNPSENILGGNDEGIYAITAANLARTGRYRLHATLLPTLPAKLVPWVTKKMPRMANRTAKPPPRYPAYHVCLFVDEATTGTLTSQFPVGFPALLASAHALFGFGGQRLVNPLLLLIAACIAGRLVTSWMGPVAGSAAFVLWLWFPLQAWAGNTRYAELLLQVFWLLTLQGVAERETRPAWAGCLAGLALGVSLSVKIDALPVMAIAAAVLVMVGDHRESVFPRVFLAALFASATCSFAILWQDNRAYAWDTLRSIGETNRRALLCAAVLGVSFILIWLTGRSRGWWTKVRAFLPQPEWWLKYALITGGMVLALYACLVRSGPAAPDSFYYWPQGATIRSFREDTFIRLVWYWQPWGLGIAVMGIFAVIRRADKIWQWLALGIGALFLIAFSYDIRNNPIQPYAFRRFLPYAVPLMIVGAAASGGWLTPRWVRGRIFPTIALTIALMLGFRPINERLNHRTEYPGLIEQLARLAGHVPDRAVVLISSDSPAVRLASALEFCFGKPCLILRIPSYNRQWAGVEIRRAAVLWSGQNRTVYVLGSWAGDKAGVEGVESRTVHRGVIRTQNIAASAKALITEQTACVIPYSLNELILTR